MPISLQESVYQSTNMPRTDAVVRGRAELLPPADRDLLLAVLLDGQSTRSLANILGQPPRMVRRRVHRLSMRITSRRFLEVARALPLLEPHLADLARLHYCHAVPSRELAQRLQMTYHEVRRDLQQVRAELYAIRRFREAGVELPLAR